MQIISARKKKLVRNQHIVPRWYLDNFGDSDGHLHVYERGKEIRPGSPEKECRERDFNEFTSFEGRRTSNEYEDWLAIIETEAKPICDALCNHQPLSPDESEVWSVFVASLFARTRKVRTQMTVKSILTMQAPAEIENFAKKIQLELVMQGRFFPFSEVHDAAKKVFGKADTNLPYYHLVNLPGNVKKISKALQSAQYGVVDATGGYRFITSDAPVVTMELMPNNTQIDFGCGFGKHKAGIFLPLTPKHAFFAVQKDWPIELLPSPVLFTLGTLQFAHRNVYANFESRELQAMVDNYINKIVFGENAMR